MSPGSPPGLLRELLTLGADALSTPGATRGVCVVMFSPVREEVEILHRRDLALEVCSALSDAPGRELLSWARRSPRAHLLRREGLARWAPGLLAAMAAENLGALALFPLLGKDSALGYIILGLAPMPRGVPLARELEERAWSQVSASLRALTQKAGNAVLREVLSLRSRGLGGGVRALVVLDAEDRVLFSHGTSRLFPAWGRGEVMGQLLRNLPGGRTLASAEVSQPGHLLWKTRSLSGVAGTQSVSLGALGLPLPGGAGGSWRMVMIRDPGASDGDGGTDGSGLLLELALRVTQPARGGEEDTGAVPDPAAEEAMSLARGALAAAEREAREERIDVSGMFRGFLSRLEPELRDDRILVLPFLASDLSPIRGERGALETAFWALIRRSWRSLLPRGGTITLRTWEEGGSVWCTVSDDGPGIEDWAVLERLSLEPLLASGEDDEPTGSEVSLARGLINAAGGALHLESRPRLWTRYSVVFPAERLVRKAAPPILAGLPPAVEVKRNGDGHLEVLVVDDNEMVRTVLRRYLERKGHAVTEAGDGGVALDMVAVREFDRIMVDIDMPGTTGVEFFERLGSVAPTLRDRTIFMTGGFQGPDTEEYIEGSGRPHIQKPFDLREIGQILQA